MISHTAVAIAAGTVFSPRPVPRQFWLVTIACAVIADLDLILFLKGVPYEHFFGHRGFFHSIFFGLLVSIAATRYAMSVQGPVPGSCMRYFLLFFIVSASHGLLDALSSGSIGVALFSPFDATRYAFPWRPISMMRARVFLSTWNFAAIRSEFFWVWMPSLLVILGVHLTRATGRRPLLRP